ncbi:hypothetical protein OV203_25570 [Nannocystis sp. ILAH1]|uniref:hypothetical protein n=1 Tax=Nannocystis sp. ILAH1 TaxID=2996789 RepID=UPI002271BC70|nr:hypothetical protein [Nannocystis sp. ILAH1]MCY0990537.1 hypothetical protein [Nannocystis sp. ILAH1]
MSPKVSVKTTQAKIRGTFGVPSISASTMVTSALESEVVRMRRGIASQAARCVSPFWPGVRFEAKHFRAAGPVDAHGSFSCSTTLIIRRSPVVSSALDRIRSSARDCLPRVCCSLARPIRPS